MIGAIVCVLLVSAGACLVRLGCQSRQCWICWLVLVFVVFGLVYFVTDDVWSAVGIVAAGTLLGLLYPELLVILKYLARPAKAVGSLVVLLALYVMFFHPTYSSQAIGVIFLVIGLGVLLKWHRPRRKNYAGELME